MAHILLVEDEPDTRYALAQVLGSVGHKIVEADSAVGASRLLAEREVDLVVCELQLANDQAAHILEEARRHTPRLDTIVICGGGLARSSRNNVAAARTLGAAAILQKPFDSDTLIAVTDNLLEEHRDRHLEPVAGG
jgi:DNA-binding NtrC family response regulator